MFVGFIKSKSDILSKLLESDTATNLVPYININQWPLQI